MPTARVLRCLLALSALALQLVIADVYYEYEDFTKSDANDTYYSDEGVYGVPGLHLQPGHSRGGGHDSLDSACPDGNCDELDEYDDQPPPPNDDYLWPTCRAVRGGATVLNGTSSCALRVVGVDAAADQLEGGLDGLYPMEGCYEGKPLYRRSGNPQEPRVLWYNPEFGDWEFSTGEEPNLDLMVMFSDYGYVSPPAVPTWHLAMSLNRQQQATMKDQDDDLFYIVPSVSVACDKDHDEL